MVDGDDSGWLCVLKEVLGVQLSMHSCSQPLSKRQ